MLSKWTQNQLYCTRLTCWDILPDKLFKNAQFKIIIIPNLPLYFIFKTERDFYFIIIIFFIWKSYFGNLCSIYLCLFAFNKLVNSSFLDVVFYWRILLVFMKELLSWHEMIRCYYSVSIWLKNKVVRMYVSCFRFLNGNLDS